MAAAADPTAGGEDLAPLLGGVRWQDKAVPAAQQALYHRARCNRAARRGEYSPEMENR